MYRIYWFCCLLFLHFYFYIYFYFLFVHSNRLGETNLMLTRDKQCFGGIPLIIALIFIIALALPGQIQRTTKLMMFVFSLILPHKKKRQKKKKKKKKKKNTEIPCNVCLYEKTLSFGKIKTNTSKCRHLIFVPTCSIICVDCPLTVILIFIDCIYNMYNLHFCNLQFFFYNLQFANCKLRKS